MESHGFALVTAGEIDPSDLALTDQLAKPGFADPEILRRLVRPQQRNGCDGFTHLLFPCLYGGFGVGIR